MKLTNKEKKILHKALEQLDKHYDELESTCRKFKWICHDYLPQSGIGYEANMNVFDIQDKTISDIHIAKQDARTLINKLIK
jgi:hypothetical protein